MTRQSLDGATILGFQRLWEAIEDREREYTATMVFGQMPDFASYKARGGYLQALKDVKDIMQDIEKRGFMDEDKHAA